jgi:nucleoside-diphosphate kinase
MEKQQALIIIKPEAVQRGLIGKVVKRFEQVGMTIVGFKFVWATEEQVKNHYPSRDDWFKKVGERTLTNYAKKGLDAKKILGTEEAIEIGKMVKRWLIDYLRESPILLMVVEGFEGIEVVRKLAGNTIPLYAAPGTIRGDFSIDNIDLANSNNRPLRNIIHASDNLEDAKKEVNLWFSNSELFQYGRADEKIMFKT